MIQLHLRLSELLNRRIAQEVRKRRLRSSAAFIRAAVETALDAGGGDPRLFKLIISPEFGERVGLETLTRGLLAKMESELSTRLEWIATTHYNTEHPHVHVVLRGINPDGQPLFLSRGYIQHGIRSHAEDLVTRRLGYRTAFDTQEARRREIHQMRYTSIDRSFQRVFHPAVIHMDSFEKRATQEGKLIETRSIRDVQMLKLKRVYDPGSRLHL